MHIFYLDEEAQQQLATLRAYAEAHPFTLNEMEAHQLVGRAWGPVDSDDFTRKFMHDTRVVLTVETTKSGQLVRHLSVSVGGKMPFPFIVQDLMSLLGFTGTLTDCLVDFSEEPYAINIIQYLTPQPA